MSLDVSFRGNLGGDPELRFTQAGKAVCSFSVANTDSRKNQATGEWEVVDTTWVRVSCFDRLAESVANNLHKGDRVVITGRLVNHEYQDKNGEVAHSLQVTATAIGLDLAGKRFQGQGQPMGQGGSLQQQAQQGWIGAQQRYQQQQQPQMRQPQQPWQGGVDNEQPPF